AADREAKAAEDRRLAEVQRQQAEDQQRLEAEKRARAEAERAAAQADAERTRAEADAVAARAARERQVAQAEIDRANKLAEQAKLDQQHLRLQLVEQFNKILETRDTTRGLIVNMSDVLFDTGKWTLKPGAREKLAKVAGIVLSHPGLKLELE